MGLTTMLRYKLRTLLILLAIVPPILAAAWFAWPKALESYRQWQFDRLAHLIQATVTGNSSGLGRP